MAKNPLNASKILFDPAENQKAFQDYAKLLQGLQENAKMAFDALTNTSKKSATQIKRLSKELTDLVATFKDLASDTDAFEGRDKKIRELINVLQALKKIEKDANVEREAAKKSHKEISALTKEYTKNLSTLTKENKKLEKQVENVTKKYDAQTKSQKAADNSLEKLRLETKEAEKTFKSLEGSIDSTGDEVEEAKQKFLSLKSQLNDANQSLRDQVKATDLAKDSYLSWQAVVTKASKELKKLEDPLGKNKDKAEALRKEINKNKDKLKDFDASIGNFQRNVGNYSSAVEGLEDAFNELPSAVSGSVGALIEFGKNLKGNKIAAAAAAVGALGAAFAQTKDGGEDIQSELAGVKSGFDALVGSAGDFVSKLKDVVTGEASLGKVSSLLSITEPFEGLPEKIEESYEAGKELEKTFISLEKVARAIEVSIAKLNVQYELQSSIADDPTKSFKEREEASLKAFELSEKIAAQEIKLAQQELNIIDKRLALKQQAGLKDKELLDQQLEAQKKLIDAEGQYTLRIRENEKQRTELKQDRLEKDLDILIDGFDNQKTINERIIGSDREGFEKKQKLLDETKKLADASFEGQKKTIGELTDKPVNIDDLLNLDATELNETIRGLGVSEIIEGRILEVVRERRLVLQDIKDAQNDLNDEVFERAELESNILLKSTLLEKLSLEERAKLKKDFASLSVKEQEEVLKAREEFIKQFNIDVQQDEINRLNAEIAARKARGEDTLQLESELADALFAQKEMQLEKESELAEKANEDAQKKIDAELALIDAQDKRFKALNTFLAKNIKDENVLRLLKVAQVIQEQKIARAKARARGEEVKGIDFSSILAGLPAFKTGVIGFDGVGTETSDSNPVLISKGESVITGKATRESKDLLTGINKGIITDKMLAPTLELNNNKQLSLDKVVIKTADNKPDIDYDLLAEKVGKLIAQNMPKVSLEKRAGYWVATERIENEIRTFKANANAFKYNV